MKKIVIILSAFIFCACSDLMDKTNLGAISSDAVWKDAQLIETYVNKLYAEYYSWERVEADMTDEGRNGYGSTAKRMIEGGWGPDWCALRWWGYSYIRKCNDILKNVPTAPIDDKLKSRILGEVTYFRASAYFHMVVRYGGVPIIKEPQTLDSPDLYPTKATIDETYSFITAEYEAAAKLLDDFKTQPDKDFGRVTWGACKAMQSRAYLYWASPLYNEKNDKTLWQKSADISKEVIASGIYKLQENPRNLFLDYRSSENIFAIYYKRPERHHGIDAWCKPLSIANGDAAHWCPIQELVDAFPTKNGLNINDDLTYDPQNPYDSRDPRLNAFIVVNNSVYCGREQFTYVSLGSVDPSWPEKEANRYKPVDTGGEHLDAAGAAHNSSTGYLNRKLVQEDLPKDVYGGDKGSETPYIDIRLGEVYLNYAEALNEIGDLDGACEQLKVIRTRAGILYPEVPVKDHISKDALRKFIQNERYIELCFENKRYWDLRRWKIAVEHLNGKKFTGVKLTLNLSENQDIINSDAYKKAKFNDQLTMLRKTWKYEYQSVDDNPYVFEPKMYFMPFPKGEIETNPNLKQNDQW